MDLIKSKIQGITIDKILDIGTETGSFLLNVTKEMEGFRLAIGIDIEYTDLEKVRGNFDNQPVSFLKADASEMPFSDSEFDLVIMNAVLHHLRDIPAVLKDSMRVLKPGGLFILKEPYCVNQKGKQQVGIASDHWFAKIDRLRGVSHNSTLKRLEIINFVKASGLTHFEFSDYVCGCDWETNGRLKEEVEEIRENLTKLGDDPESAALRTEGENIIKRLLDTGASCATALELIGVKD